MIPWTIARHVPLSMEFSRQEYQSELPCPPPGDLPNPGIEGTSPALQVDSLPLRHWERHKIISYPHGICGFVPYEGLCINLTLSEGTPPGHHMKRLPPNTSPCMQTPQIESGVLCNRLVPNWERSTSRLYIVTLYII